MKLNTEDRERLRDSVKGLLLQHWPSENALTLQARTESAKALWQLLAKQGLTALGYHAGGGGLTEILLLQEELGRAACPAPLAGAALIHLLLALRHPDNKKLTSLMEALHTGDALPALALRSGDKGEGRAEWHSGQLNGMVRFVEQSRDATHFLVEVDGGVALAARDQSIQVTHLPGYSTPALSVLQFTSTPATLFVLEREALADLTRLARLQLAARALGAAQRGFELVVEHVKMRKQFGVALGTFQAVQHKLANCLIHLEGSRLQLEFCADLYDSQTPGWRVAGATATAFAGQALRQTVLETHHAFGAIGYSEEHELPRHFRRVHGDLARLGGVQHARHEVAAHLLDSNESAMPDVDLGPAANAFRQEVKAFLQEHWNARHRDHQRSTVALKDRPWNPEFSRKLSAKGWLSLSWPKAFGGQQRSPLEQAVFVEEMAFANAPMTAHICATDLIAPAIIAFGTTEQKANLLPAIERNEISCCLGYSEPEAGSDLSSLRTRAERDGDHWIINGQKLWTTTGEKASHVWLAVRTGPQAMPKAKGISVFLVPLVTPGITIQPGMAMYGHTFCTVFYDNVRVPDSARVGELNGGWSVITHALAAERILMGGNVAFLSGFFQDFIAHLRATHTDGHRLGDDPIIRDRVAQMAAEIEVARHFATRSVKLVEAGKVPVYEAAISKVFYGELMERTLETAIDILGTAATLSEEASDAPLQGRIEQMLRASIMMVVGGGAAEIQRTLIAQQGIGLPRK